MHLCSAGILPTLTEAIRAAQPSPTRQQLPWIPGTPNGVDWASNIIATEAPTKGKPKCMIQPRPLTPVAPLTLSYPLASRANRGLSPALTGSMQQQP